jgi:hypothetical protein
VSSQISNKVYTHYPFHSEILRGLGEFEEEPSFFSAAAAAAAEAAAKADAALCSNNAFHCSRDFISENLGNNIFIIVFKIR